MNSVGIPNYKILRENAKQVAKASDRIHVPQYDATIGQEGLQYDQSVGRSVLMQERKATMQVQDYQQGQFIHTAPHDEELKKMLISRLGFSLPQSVYNSVITDSRMLPNIRFLEQMVSTYYSQILVNNLMNIYTHSPAFFADTLIKSEYNFKTYEKFIYLLTYIQIVLEHRDQQDFMEKDDRIGNVVQWCLTRQLQDIDYLLRGPESNQLYTLDYEQVYQRLISPSTDKNSVTSYLTLATLQEVSRCFSKYRDEFAQRPNAYDKNPNYAQSYTISIDTRENAIFKKDSIGNLIVDCSNIDLGSSTNDNINLNINEATVNTDSLKYEPKSQAIKFSNIMHQFSIFRIQSLLILKSTYKTSLKNYDTCYITFPNITLDGRFNQVYKSGTLQIPGKFQENNNNKYWEFVPFNEVVYIPKTANVKRFEFYISPKPGTNHKPIANNFKISTELNKYFNIPIRVHSVDELNDTPLAPSEDLLPDTYLIRCYSIGHNGKPLAEEYAFLYNQTYHTLQALPSQYDVDHLPKFGSKQRLKTIQIHNSMSRPTYPPTSVYIREVIDIAHKNGTTTFGLPRTQPLTTAEGLVSLMAEARLKGVSYVDLISDVKALKISINTDAETVIQRTINSLTPEQIGLYVDELKGTHVDNPLDVFHNELINQINDARINKKDYFWISIRKHQHFDFLSTDNPYDLAQQINTTMYDYSSALCIKLSAIERLFSISYIKSLIQQSIKQHQSVISLNNTAYLYFELYLEDGGKCGGIDVPELYEALKNGQPTFHSDIFGTIYIKLISPLTIQRNIKQIDATYVKSMIRANVDGDDVKPMIDILGTTYQAYYLKQREIVDIPIPDTLPTSFTHHGTTYYVDYYVQEVKSKIVDDIAHAQSTYVVVNGVKYRYVECHESDKQLVYDALGQGKNEYVKDGQHIPIQLLTRDIVKASAHVWKYSDANVVRTISIQDFNNGYVVIDSKRYDVFTNEVKIATQLNMINLVEYTDDNLRHDIAAAVQSMSDSVLGVKFVSGQDIIKTFASINDRMSAGELSEDDVYDELCHTSNISVLTLPELKYQIACETGGLDAYITELEGKLSDEYELARRSWDVYQQSDQANVIQTTTDLPNILPTDDVNDIYQKWSNYYAYYNLFISDFNYDISYEPLQTCDMNIYDSSANIIQQSYTLLDWIVPLYDMYGKRVAKRVDAVKMKVGDEMMYVENVVYDVDVELKNVIESSDGYVLVWDEVMYDVVVNVKDEKMCEVKLCRNGSTVNSTTTNIIHFPDNIPIPDDNIIIIGLSDSVVLDSVMIDGKPLSEWSVNDLFAYACIRVNGVYSDRFTENEVISNPTKPITITYNIQRNYTDADGNATLFTTSLSTTYDRPLTLLHDLNDIVADKLCYRNFDIVKNKYKTFIVKEDIFERFSVDDWLYSLNRLSGEAVNISPYIDVKDLGLSTLTNMNKTADFKQYMQPVIIKYFIQWINNYSKHLIVYSADYGFSDVSAFVDGTEYKLQVITDNLFSLDYDKVVDDVLEIYSSGSRFKMIIKLL